MSETTEIIPQRSICPSCGASASNEYQHAPTCIINTSQRLAPLSPFRQFLKDLDAAEQKRKVP